eukprot:5322195-Prymnesium_polylepis.1
MYQQYQRFTSGCTVSDPCFGVGLVQELLPDKCMIKFDDGHRIRTYGHLKVVVPPSAPPPPPAPAPSPPPPPQAPPPPCQRQRRQLGRELRAENGLRSDFDEVVVAGEGGAQPALFMITMS